MRPFRAAAVLLLAAAYPLVPAPAAQAAAACPMVVAHRTGPQDAPENSIPGIAKAAAAGAGWVEADIRFSKSTAPTNGAFPMLVHDATIDRTTDGTGTVADLWFTEVREHSAAAYAPWSSNPAFAGYKPDGTPKTLVPYAWDLFLAASDLGLRVLLDVKVTPNRQQADKLIDYVDRFDYRNRIIYMSSAASVTAMHAWYPDLAYLVIEYPPAGMMRTAESVRATGAMGYAVSDSRIAAKPFVDYYHASGLQVWTWTSDDPARDVVANWARLAGYGVYALVTNRPGDLVAMCGEG